MVHVRGALAGRDRLAHAGSDGVPAAGTAQHGAMALSRRRGAGHCLLRHAIRPPPEPRRHRQRPLCLPADGGRSGDHGRSQAPLPPRRGGHRGASAPVATGANGLPPAARGRGRHGLATGLVGAPGHPLCAGRRSVGPVGRASVPLAQRLANGPAHGHLAARTG